MDAIRPRQAHDVEGASARSYSTKSAFSVEPICFFRGRHLYEIARARGGGDGYIGIVDGCVVARARERAAVARALISPKIAYSAAMGRRP